MPGGNLLPKRLHGEHPRQSSHVHLVGHGAGLLPHHGSHTLDVVVVAAGVVNTTWVQVFKRFWTMVIRFGDMNIWSTFFA